MTKPLFYIRCEDECSIAVHGGESPSQDNGLTALMANPAASNSVLIDAAFARSERIRAITAIFSFISPNDLGEIDPDTMSDFFIAINGMSQEVSRLCEAAQFAATGNKGASHE